MDTVDEFLASVVERHRRATTSVRNGDPAPFIEMLSPHDPVTLLPAAQQPQVGFEAVSAAIRRVAGAYSGAASVEFEVIAAGVSGDLAYVVGFERGAASVGGDARNQVNLRVTHVYRREDGEWRLAHRHADPGSDTRDAVDDLRASLPR
jgi:uncharacterized protein (TIGR02246 family)